MWGVKRNKTDGHVNEIKTPPNIGLCIFKPCSVEYSLEWHSAAEPQAKKRVHEKHEKCADFFFRVFRDFRGQIFFVDKETHEKNKKWTDSSIEGLA
uniref:Uncharacterized protein n=1 Tax=Candidatus Kentrum sp. FW TaxID=2126338 RepID=A0A450TGR2_9GAMM|nr:MAG: hypothetical protein BECKFW1821C_GA0114237_100956 [Candidatus Kentron sp. FW]